jgi:protein-tyrosine phosphatase
MHATCRLAEELNARQIPLTLYPGAELRLDADLPQSIQDGKLLTINDTGCFALIELPETIIPPGLEDFFWELRRRRITPIISHPERNRGFHSNPVALYRLVRMGVLTQITCASVLGHFGARVKEFSLLLLRQHWCHVLASDAHGRRQRSPRLTEGRRAVEKVVGREAARWMVDDTPYRIVAGLPVRTPEPAEWKPLRLRFWRRDRAVETS